MAGFDALLYTPNIRGIMWLLIQHQDTLGKKAIDSIEVSPEADGSLRLSHSNSRFLDLRRIRHPFLFSFPHSAFEGCRAELGPREIG